MLLQQLGQGAVLPRRSFEDSAYNKNDVAAGELGHSCEVFVAIATIVAASRIVPRIRYLLSNRSGGAYASSRMNTVGFDISAIDGKHLPFAAGELLTSRDKCCRAGRNFA